MQLEYGKRYVTKSGLITAPLTEAQSLYGDYLFWDDKNKWAFTEYGYHVPINQPSKFDLVSEYIEPDNDYQDFLEKIKTAKTDLHLVGLVSMYLPQADMAVIVAALTRAQELILKQKGIEL